MSKSSGGLGRRTSQADEVVGQQSGTMTRVSAIHSRQAADRDGSSEEAKEEDEKAKEGEKYRAKSVNEAVKSDQKKIISSSSLQNTKLLTLQTLNDRTGPNFKLF